MKKSKRLISGILSLCMVMGLLSGFVLPTAVSAAESQTGLAGIVKPWDNTLSAGEYTYEGKYTGDYVYMGKYNGEPIKWRVLAEPERVQDTLLKRGVAPNVITNRYLMISDEILDNIKYDSDVDHYSFNNSLAQEWSNDFLADSFSNEEKAVIKEIKNLDCIELDYNAATKYIETMLIDVKMFFPSAQEVVDYMPDARDRIGYYNGTPAKWWLRDTATNKVKYQTMVGNVLENGLASSDYATNTYGVRPAFYFDWTQVAYLVPANNSGVINFGESLPGITREWKPVLKNNVEFSGELSGTTMLTHGYENAELTFTHPELNTYNKGYTNLMASLTDNDGMLLYYGIIDDNVGDTAQIHIPVGLDEGKYTLSIFPAVINLEKEADYISKTYFEAGISVESDPVCEINEENFPDEEFRYYISRYVDTNESGSLSEIEIANCTSLNLDDCGIAKLNGIEFFTNLKYLYVRNNRLEVIKLSDNTALVGLYCNNNSLTALDLTANVNLETLDCSDNNIDDIKIDNSIKYLTIANNNMSFLDVSDEAFIIAFGQEISLEMNASRQIYMSGIVSDVSMIEMVSGGSIADGIITVDNNAEEIKYKYYCSSSKKNWVEVTADVTYKTIGINEAYFPDPVFREYVAQFDTDEDGILTATELGAVESIDVRYDTELGGTKIADLTGLEHFVNMSELTIEGQALTTLDLSKNWNLQRVYVPNNNLTGINLSGNANLEYLNVSGNNLLELHIEENTKLLTLDASANFLTTLDLSRNTLLEELVAGYPLEWINESEPYSNRLDSLDLSGLTKLEYLNVSGNRLTSLDLSDNTALIEINLENNNLPGVELDGLTALKFVKLGDNKVYVNVPKGGSVAISDIGITADEVKEVLEPAMLMESSIVLSSDGIAEYSYDTGINLPESPENLMGSAMIITLVSHTDEDHTFSDVYEMNSTRHWKYCTMCGVKSENKIHSYGFEQTNNDGTHILACKCGAEKIEKCVNRDADCINLSKKCTLCDGYCEVQSINHRGPFVSQRTGGFYVSMEHAGYAANLKCEACGEDAYKGVSAVADYSVRTIAVEFDETAVAVIVEKAPGTLVTVKADDIAATWETEFTDAQKKAVGEAVVIGGVRAGITAKGSDGTEEPISDLGDGIASVYMPIDASKLPINWKPEGIVARYIGEDGNVERVPVTVAVSTSATVSGAFDADTSDIVAKITSSASNDASITINDGNALIASLVSSDITREQALNKLLKSQAVYAKVDVSHFSDYVILYDEDLVKKTVTFDAQNGNVSPESDKTTVDGKLLELPTPTRSGYDFDGWFDSASGGNEITADTVFAEDTTIYAQWTKVSGGSTGGSGTTKYTVTFETDGGTEIEAVKVTRNGKVKKPDEPTNGNAIFRGWYTDKELTEEYDFDSKVTKNFTLYAKWSYGDGSPLAWKNPFSDVKESDWFYENVKYVFENNLMKGTSETTFAPNMNITRGMFVTILYRAEGEPAVNKSIPFADVKANEYYANAVAWANANGIVKGISETEFAPNANITREQMATILYRYAQFKEYDVSVGEDTNILSYADFDKISEYAIPAMQYAAGSGLIKGRTESTLNPQDNATRAETAAILQRFIESNSK